MFVTEYELSGNVERTLGKPFIPLINCNPNECPIASKILHLSQSCRAKEVYDLDNNNKDCCPLMNENLNVRFDDSFEKEKRTWK